MLYKRKNKVHKEITMKICFIAIAMICLGCMLFAQTEANGLDHESVTEINNQEQNHEIVMLTIQTINEKSGLFLNSHLSDDFSFLNFRKPMVTTVLNQYLAQLGEVTEFRKISESVDNGNLTLIYEFDFSGNLGTRNVTFVFDENQLLKQLDLLQTEGQIIHTSPDGNPGNGHRHY